MREREREKKKRLLATNSLGGLEKSTIFLNVFSDSPLQHFHSRDAPNESTSDKLISIRDCAGNVPRRQKKVLLRGREEQEVSRKLNFFPPPPFPRRGGTGLKTD